MLLTTLIIIRNRPSKGIYVCPESEFQNLLFLVLRTEAMSVSGFHYCICICVINGDLLEGGAIQNTTVVWASSV